MGQTGRLSGARDRVTSRSALDAKKKTRGHSCTSRTEQHQALRSFKCCAHTQRAHARQHNTKLPRVRGVAVSSFRYSSSPAIHRVSLCEVVPSGADGPPQWRPRQSHLAQRPGREKENTLTQLHLTHRTTPSTQEFHSLSLTHSLTHTLTDSLTHTLRRARHTQCTAQERA